MLSEQTKMVLSINLYRKRHCFVTVVVKCEAWEQFDGEIPYRMESYNVTIASS